MRSYLALFALLFLANFVVAQTPAERPKLVVGLVVDQMRYDYLYRYWDKYSSGGFKRLITQGFNCRNNHYAYAFTETGPGHATIYSGTTPSVHGIVGNMWYDKYQERMVYCAEDKTVAAVGAPDNAALQMSPRNLLVTTLGDELKLATNHRAKVIGVALKDRSSIFPAGFFSNGTYWMDVKTGNFVTSNFYTNTLPNWVQQFNERKMAQELAKKTWTPLLPLAQYTESDVDDSPYEGKYSNEDKPVFPHKPEEIRNLPYSPWGSTLTTEMAKAALLNEQLGKDAITDLLAISYSSTDYVGHLFGTSSIEAEDTYLRLDLELAGLLNFLDQEVGKDQYLVFLSADHGAPFNRSYMSDRRYQKWAVMGPAIQDSLNQHLAKLFGAKKLVPIYNEQELFFDHKLIQEYKLYKPDVERATVEFLLTRPEIACAFVPLNANISTCSGFRRDLLQNNYHSKRSGDVMFSLEPGFLNSDYPKGVTHGVAYEYDTHVPLLFYGWKIEPGTTNQPTYVHDIAPTVADWLSINAPNGASGKPVMGVKLKK
ncbi:alkaline phosphatase PafA [Haliscomenobacter sp.]|uniref:alkaline phosphatase PafA n=1 Tax=Haliscomenobacter sp. TaxID=2717303 RepID=UPI003593E98E